VTAAGLAEVLERLCTLMRTEARLRGLPHGLQPVQVEALIYLERCNRYSDTPQAVTEYLGLTKGTVSQTLQVLESRGLIVKTGDARDRRRVHLALTAAGRRLSRRLAASPPLESALRAISSEEGQLTDGLRRLLAQMQRSAGHRTFGACHSCRHFLKEDVGFRCGLTGEALTRTDSLRICREHEPADSPGTTTP
jgi:DNA-binding MarR family transcriptional regulator